jgi:hypothetical protein
VRFAAVERLELLQPGDVEQREARVGNRAKIAAAAFHGKDAHRRAGHRIGQDDLRACVSTAEIGDAQVRAEQVGAVGQERQLVAGKRGRSLLVPEIVQP